MKTVGNISRHLFFVPLGFFSTSAALTACPLYFLWIPRSIVFAQWPLLWNGKTVDNRALTMGLFDCMCEGLFGGGSEGLGHSCPAVLRCVRWFFFFSPQTSNLFLLFSQMKTSSSNTTEPSCCPWPIAGKTPTAHSFLCEWHRAKSKSLCTFLKPARCKMLGCFHCFCFFFACCPFLWRETL